MNGLAADEMVVFSDAVHPEQPEPPAHGWFPKGQKPALKATSGPQAAQHSGRADLETFQFTLWKREDQCPDNQTDLAKLSATTKP